MSDPQLMGWNRWTFGGAIQTRQIADRKREEVDSSLAGKALVDMERAQSAR